MPDIIIDKIIRSKRRTLSIVVNDDSQIIIRAPKYVSLDAIKKIVESKKSWIIKKYEESKKKKQTNKPKEFVDGEEILFIGSKYSLKIVNEPELFNIEGSYIKLSQKYVEKAKSLLIYWYKKQAHIKFQERLNLYSKITKLNYKSIRITSARKCWGSCGPKGTLNFTWRLVMAPLKIVDYVVIHELMHIVEKNHSKNFWNKVIKYCPDYKTRRKWLKDNGYLLDIK